MKKILLLLIPILAVLFILPIAVTISQSFYSDNSFHIDGYFNLFFNYFNFYPMFWNSILYATIITFFQLLIIIPCAFGLIHAKFKGKGILYVFYIMLMMMPLQVTVLPNYIGLRDLDLIDTRLGIILPMIFSPFGVIVMYQYMKNIDNSSLEAARLETSSIIRIMLRFVIPQLRVCIYAVTLFAFAESWNMVEQPMLFLKEDRLKNLTVFISHLMSSTGDATVSNLTTVIFATSVIFMIPIFLLFMFFNSNLEEGLRLNNIYKK